MLDTHNKQYWEIENSIIYSIPWQPFVLTGSKYSILSTYSMEFMLAFIPSLISSLHARKSILAPEHEMKIHLKNTPTFHISCLQSVSVAVEIIYLPISLPVPMLRFTIRFSCSVSLPCSSNMKKIIWKTWSARRKLIGSGWYETYQMFDFKIDLLKKEEGVSFIIVRYGR